MNKKKVKGCSQKCGNKKGVTSGSKWDGEDMEQEEELGETFSINIKQLLLLLQKN